MQDTSFFSGSKTIYWDEDKKRLLVRMRKNGPLTSGGLFEFHLPGSEPTDPDNPDNPDNPDQPDDPDDPTTPDEPILVFSSTTYDTLNEWEFSKDNNSFTTVTLPHTCNTIDGYSNSMYRGFTYYKKTIDIEEADLTKMRVLVFRAIGQRSTVSINGTEVATKLDGYTPLIVEMSNLVAGDNTIEVVCDNSPSGDSIPVSADFNFNNGLHEMVYLYTIDGIGFDADTYGVDRMHIDTEFDGDKANVTIHKGIVNGSTSDIDVTIDTEFGTLKESKTINIKSKTTESIDTIFTIDNPKLWNGLFDAYLYDVKITLTYKDTKLDEQSIKYGIRKFEIREDGFYLNDNWMPLRGAAVHQDDPVHMSAMTKEDFDRDYGIIEELGCNFIRLAHYTHDKYAFDKCDELGIVVQTEVPWVNHIGPNANQSYHDSIKGAIESMIKNYYNHPSIIFWGLSNELNGSHWKASNGADPQGGFSSTLALQWMNEFYAYAKSLDPYRLVGFTAHSSTFNGGNTIDKWDADFVAMNEYRGWYSGVFTDFGADMDKYYTSKKAVAIGEYGAGNNPNTHSSDPFSTTNRGSGGARHDEEYANLFHESHVVQIQERPWLLYTSIWSLFDFTVAARNEGGTPYTNDKGIVTRDRTLKKDAFYLYKTLWSTEKVTYISSRRFTNRTDNHITIKAYSNASTVELYKDGLLVQTLPNNKVHGVGGVIYEFDDILFDKESITFKVVGSYIDGSKSEDEVTFTTNNVYETPDPDAYDYVTLTDTYSAINTGYIPTADTRIEIKADIGKVNDSNVQLFGSRTSSSASDKFNLYMSVKDGVLNFMYGDSNTGNPSFDLTDDCSYTIYADKDKCIVNNVEYPVSPAGNFTGSTLPMYIFACNQNGSVFSPTPIGSVLYYFKIYNGDELVHHYVPSLDEYGKLVLEDKVGGGTILLPENNWTPAPVTDFLSVNTTSITIPVEGGTGEFNISESTGSYTIVSDNNWISVSDNNGTVTVTVDPSSETVVRNGIVRVFTGLYLVKVVITQDANTEPSIAQLEYLTVSDTTAYIPTDIQLNTLSLDIEVKGSTTSGSSAFFGSRYSNSKYRIDGMRGNDSADWLYTTADAYTALSVSSGKNTVDDLVHVFVFKFGEGLIVDDNAYGPYEGRVFPTPFDMQVPFYFFGENTNGNLSNSQGTRTIYYIKIYKDSEIINWLVPIKDDNNAYALLDKVTGKTYYPNKPESFTSDLDVETT